MRIILYTLLAITAGGASAWADPGRPQTFYVRYAVNMDFLPPLIGEKRCVRFRPCDLVRLDHFSVTLTALEDDSYGDRGRLAIDCRNRECALREGQDVIEFRKQKRLAQFSVDDREYRKDSRAVMRYRGELIGEILLAY